MDGTRGERIISVYKCVEQGYVRGNLVIWMCACDLQDCYMVIYTYTGMGHGTRGVGKESSLQELIMEWVLNYL